METSGLNARQLRGIARRRAWVVLLCAGFAALSGLAVSVLSAKVYSASADLALNNLDPAVLFSPTTPVDQQFVATQVELVRSAPVEREVNARLGRSARDVDRVDVFSVGPTNVVRITVESLDPRVAQRAANLYAHVFEGLADQRMQDRFAVAEDRLENQVVEAQTQTFELEASIGALQASPDANAAELQRQEAAREALESKLSALQAQYLAIVQAAPVTSGNARVAVEAVLESEPVRPDILHNSLIALGLGVLVGLGIVLVAEGLGDRILTRGDLEGIVDVPPLLAEIPAAKSWQTRHGARFVIAEGPASPVGTAFGVLAQSIERVTESRPLTLLVTSPTQSAGVTTVVVNLGRTMARERQRVVILDLNLRRPLVGDMLDVAASGGVVALLRGEAPLREVVRRVPVVDGMNMLVIPAGRPPSDPSRLLERVGVVKLLTSVRKGADVILVDAPAVLDFRDATAMGSAVDGVILVLGAGATSQSDAIRAIAALREKKTPVVGVVLNYAPISRRAHPAPVPADVLGGSDDAVARPSKVSRHK